jgi:hypothetical protein
MLNSSRAVGRLSAIGLALVLIGVSGCGGIKTHPVKGKVVVEGGDVKKLVGANVEFQLDSDPSVRSYGEIKEDGTFELMTYHKGKSVPGVPEGKAKPPPLPIHARFLRFTTSKLSFTVPTDGEITVKVSVK